MRPEAKPYQQAIVDGTAEAPAIALFLEQGLGKSRIAIDTLMVQFNAGVKWHIVVSKTSVVANWFYNELPTHMPNSYEVCLYTGSRKAKAKQELRKMKLINTTVPKIILISDSMLRTADAYNEMLTILKEPTGIIVDESTIIKNPAAQITKKVLTLSKNAVYKRLLCGEPAPQGPVDYFSQFKFLDGRILGIGTFSAYKNMFVKQEDIWINGRKILKPLGEFSENAKDTFEALIKPYTIRLRKKDVLHDLGEKQYIVRKYEMDSAARKVYEKLREEYFTDLINKDGTHHMTATLAATRAMRLHQIVSGFMVDEQENIHDLENGRFETLVDILDERPAGSKTIIWAHYRYCIEYLQKRLSDLYGPESNVIIYGGIDDDKIQSDLNRFKTSPECRYLIANPAKAAWSLTLTEADANVYYCNSYNWEHRAQSEDRTHRIGQVSDVVQYYDILAANTMDEKVLDVLQNKASFSQSVMADFVHWFKPLGV